MQKTKPMPWKPKMPLKTKSPPQVRKVKSLRKKIRKAFDSETTGVDIAHGCKPFFISVTKEGEEPRHWHFRVDPFTRQPKIPKSQLKEIQEELDEADEAYFQNPRFDFRAFESIGLTPPAWNKVKDTLLAGHLLASNQPHDLTSMTLIYLGVNTKPFEDNLLQAVEEARRMARKKSFIEEHGLWLQAKEGMESLPSIKGSGKAKHCDYWLPGELAITLNLPEDHQWHTVLPEYGDSDTMVLLPLYDAMMKEIDSRQLRAIYEKRLEILPVVAEMESRGVTASHPRTMKLKKTYQEASQRMNAICTTLSEGEIEQLPDGGSSNALKSILFDKFKLVPYKKTKKGGDCIDKTVLEDWMAKLPSDSKEYCFVKNLYHYRKRRTALGFIESYESYWQDIAGSDYRRLLYSLNPTGTSTLRFTSQNPNTQQISKQEIYDGKDLSHNARYMFGPGEGREWWSMDASNIELRIPAYEAGEEAMIELFERPNDPPYFGSNHLFFFDILHPDKFAKYGADVKKVYKDTWYQWTKNGDFAVQYGAVASSGTADRAYHLMGAQQMIEEKLTAIKELSNRCIKFANENGYVETIPDLSVDPDHGYPLLCTRTKWGGVLPTVPLSYHVQGTAMWWMMKAMLRCNNFLKQLNSSSQTWKRVMGNVLRPKGEYHIVLQVHDELVFDFPHLPNQGNLPIIRELKKLMEVGGEDISIPTPVNVEYHPDNWGSGLSVKLSA